MCNNYLLDHRKKSSDYRILVTNTLTFLARKLEIALKELSNACAIDRASDTYIYSHTTAIGSDMKSGRYPTLYGSSGLH